jgi:hypothetical protein
MPISNFERSLQIESVSSRQMLRLIKSPTMSPILPRRRNRFLRSFDLKSAPHATLRCRTTSDKPKRPVQLKKYRVTQILSGFYLFFVKMCNQRPETQENLLHSFLLPCGVTHVTKRLLSYLIAKSRGQKVEVPIYRPLLLQASLPVSVVVISLRHGLDGRCRCSIKGKGQKPPGEPALLN